MNSNDIWRALQKKGQNKWKYPVTVRALRHEDRNIKGLFFPVGSGLLDKRDLNSTIPKNPIIFLGQDFSDQNYLDNKLERGEKNSPTVSNLYKLLEDNKIEPNVLAEKSFFTNCYYGIRINDGMKNPIKWKEVQEESIDFFRESIIVGIKPSKIVLLGNKPVSFFHNLASTKETIKIFKEKLKNKGRYNYNGIAIYHMPHPSMMFANERYYGGRDGLSFIIRNILF